MPDMEREMREFEIHLAKSDDARALVRARHQGEDAARRQVAWVFLGLALFAVIVYSLIYW